MVNQDASYKADYKITCKYLKIVSDVNRETLQSLSTAIFTITAPVTPALQLQTEVFNRA